MPDLATTGSMMRVLRWVKQPGQPVARGDILLEVETDKSAMEVESPVAGILREARFAPDAEVAGGDVLAVFELADAPAAPASTPPPVPPAPNPVPPAQPTAAPGGLFARNRAAALAPAGEPARPEIALTPARRTAARRLQESKQTVPHFYLQASVDATALLARRAAAGEPKPVWDAFFAQAVARVLPRFDRLTCRFEDGRLLPAPNSRIGVAADIDDELFVVSVEAAATKTVAEISDQIRSVVTGLRAGDATLRRIVPGAFTISNLGSTGVESFTAIINPPEAAILAFGAIRRVVVPGPDGFLTQPRIQLTLSADHRVVNGKYAAGFLAAVVQALESSAP